MAVLKIVFFGIVVLVLIVFLVKRNRKDKIEFENYLNNDYPKVKDKEGDIDID